MGVNATFGVRRSASEGGGTARFVSRLIGECEVPREHVQKTAYDDALIYATYPASNWLTGRYCGR